MLNLEIHKSGKMKFEPVIGLEVHAQLKTKTKIFGFFVGQVMKETKGRANPKIVNEILKDLL